MASSFPHSKYRKETSKQNSREDNHWSPSKPRSITLKRGGSSYQRNQHKPLSRHLMPGLVLSLSLFLSLLNTAMLQLNTSRAHAGRRGGAMEAWLHTLSLLPLLSILLSPFFISPPCNFSCAGHRTPGQSVSAPPPDPRTPTPRPPRHTQRLKMTFPHPRGHPPPPSLVTPNPISKAWVFLIYWWSHTLTLSLQLCWTAHWQD